MSRARFRLAAAILAASFTVLSGHAQATAEILMSRQFYLRQTGPTLTENAGAVVVIPIPSIPATQLEVRTPQGPIIFARNTAGTFEKTFAQLALFNGSQARIAGNDDWGGGEALAAAFRSVGAFALGSNSRDAAVTATLAAGSYTVEVKPGAGSSGLALVEVYELP